MKFLELTESLIRGGAKAPLSDLEKAGQKRFAVAPEGTVSKDKKTKKQGGKWVPNKQIKKVVKEEKPKSTTHFRSLPKFSTHERVVRLHPQRKVKQISIRRPNGKMGYVTYHGKRQPDPHKQIPEKEFQEYRNTLKIDFSAGESIPEGVVKIQNGVKVIGLRMGYDKKGRKEKELIYFPYTGKTPASKGPIQKKNVASASEVQAIKEKIEGDKRKEKEDDWVSDAEMDRRAVSARRKFMDETRSALEGLIASQQRLPGSHPALRQNQLERMFKPRTPEQIQVTKDEEIRRQPPKAQKLRHTGVDTYKIQVDGRPATSWFPNAVVRVGKKFYRIRNYYNNRTGREYTLRPASRKSWNLRPFRSIQGRKFNVGEIRRNESTGEYMKIESVEPLGNKFDIRGRMITAEEARQSTRLEDKARQAVAKKAKALFDFKSSVLVQGEETDNALDKVYIGLASVQERLIAAKDKLDAAKRSGKTPATIRKLTRELDKEQNEYATYPPLLEVKRIATDDTGGYWDKYKGKVYYSNLERNISNQRTTASPRMIAGAIKRGILSGS